MKLNAKHFRYLSAEDWRVLTAFELGSKNHEVVPTPLAVQLSALKTGANAVNRSISTLAKVGLVAKVKNAKYDGYRLTYGGYDYLALHALTRSNAILQLGSTLGVGKESDILLVTSPAPDGLDNQVEAVLKIHRLGRTSFRTVANNRAYLGKRSHSSWQYLSRLSAQKEMLAMRLLHDAGFKVPRPIGSSRHAVVMSLVPGMPLRAVPLNTFGRTKQKQEQHVSTLYAELLEIVLDLAGRGVIHGDMNEFNIMLEGVQLAQDGMDDMAEEGYEEKTALDEELSSTQHQLPGVDVARSESQDEPNDPNLDDDDDDNMLTVVPHIIDFPQITSMSHPQASEYFDRDVNGIKAFFRKKYHYSSQELGPSFTDATARLESASQQGIRRLDVAMEAAGFDKKAAYKSVQEHLIDPPLDTSGTEAGLSSGEHLDTKSRPNAEQFTGSLSSLPTGQNGRQKAAAGWSL